MATRKDVTALYINEEYISKLMLIPRAYSFDEETCEDVIQETFKRMFEKSDLALLIIINLRGYVWRIAKNVTAKRSKETWYEEFDDTKEIEDKADATDPLFILNIEQIIEWVRKERRNPERDIIILKMLSESAEYYQIAEKIGENVNNTKQLIHRLRQWIIEKINNEKSK